MSVGVICNDGKETIDQVTDTSNSIKDLEPEAALCLLKPFLANEWGKLGANDVSLRKITLVLNQL